MGGRAGRVCRPWRVPPLSPSLSLKKVYSLQTHRGRRPQTSLSCRTNPSRTHLKSAMEPGQTPEPEDSSYLWWGALFGFLLYCIVWSCRRPPRLQAGAAPALHSCWEAGWDVAPPLLPAWILVPVWTTTLEDRFSHKSKNARTLLNEMFVAKSGKCALKAGETDSSAVNDGRDECRISVLEAELMQAIFKKSNCW